MCAEFTVACLVKINWLHSNVNNQASIQKYFADLGALEVANAIRNETFFGTPITF